MRTTDRARPLAFLTALALAATFAAPAGPAYAQNEGTRIREIQGAAHTSPLTGRRLLNVPGIVTARSRDGFWMQDPTPDDNVATSEGIFVYTRTAPTVNPGDSVTVTGTVAEYRPASNSLTITQLTSPAVTVRSSGNPLPAPVVIGTGGRIPPRSVIDDDAGGSVETQGSFDAATDGIDFYESLEGMWVQVNNPVVVGPRKGHGEITVVGDNGANATQLNNRGALAIRAGDFNPERIILDDLLAPTPPANVGDRITGPVTGVIHYSFGNFKLLPTASPAVTAGNTARVVATPAAANELALATLNVENLDPGDPPAKFTQLAEIIVTNMKAPDLVALEEVQDNNGPTNDNVVDASQTVTRLIEAIRAAGGPAYEFRQINPQDDQDGGEPGGNIRVVFLFRTDRGLRFVDRAGGTATTPTQAVRGTGGAELTHSPGRVDPTNPAWQATRKPLAGEFRWRGLRLFVIGNHFSSKGGDDPLFGRQQPPVESSAPKRHQQAQIVHTFARSIATADPDARIVVLGDLNDFQFSETLRILKGTLLHNPMEALPPTEQYTYVFDGNAQALDHILMTANLRDRISGYDIVHVNAEFAVQTSDHDPQVIRIAR